MKLTSVVVIVQALNFIEESPPPTYARLGLLTSQMTITFGSFVIASISVHHTFRIRVAYGVEPVKLRFILYFEPNCEISFLL